MHRICHQPIQNRRCFRVEDSIESGHPSIIRRESWVVLIIITQCSCMSHTHSPNTVTTPGRWTRWPPESFHPPADLGTWSRFRMPPEVPQNGRRAWGVDCTCAMLSMLWCFWCFKPLAVTLQDLQATVHSMFTYVIKDTQWTSITHPICQPVRFLVPSALSTNRSCKHRWKLQNQPRFHVKDQLLEHFLALHGLQSLGQILWLRVQECPKIMNNSVYMKEI